MLINAKKSLAASFADVLYYLQISSGKFQINFLMRHIILGSIMCVDSHCLFYQALFVVYSVFLKLFVLVYVDVLDMEYISLNVCAFTCVCFDMSVCLFHVCFVLGVAQ